MANPQPTPFVQFSKELFDALLVCPMPATHKEVVLAVIRHTYGGVRRRKEAPISQSLLQAMTGRHRNGISRALRELIAEGVVREVSPAGFRSAAVLGLNKDYENWGRWSVQRHTLMCLSQEVCEAHPDVGGEAHYSVGGEAHPDVPIKEVKNKRIPVGHDGTSCGTSPSNNGVGNAAALVARYVDGMRAAGHAFTRADKGQFARYVKDVLDQGCSFALAQAATDMLVEKGLRPGLIGQLANQIRAGTDVAKTPEGKKERYERLRTQVGERAAREAVYG